MTKEESLKNELVDILTRLQPHFEEAGDLISALEAWADYELMLELAALLETAAESVDDSEKSHALRSAISAVKERRRIEEEERAAESRNAETTIDIDFP